MSKILPIGDPESDPPGVHEISRRVGWDMIRRHRENQPALAASEDAEMPWMTMRFHAEAIKRLLKTKGAKVFAVHKATYPDGRETLVLSAEDADGKELKGGEIYMMNDGSPCPPDCPPPD